MNGFKYKNSKKFAFSILDSSLISQTFYQNYKNLFNVKYNKKVYNIKIIRCGDFIQVYKFKNRRLKKDKSLLPLNDIDITDMLYKNYDNLIKEEEEINIKDSNVIEKRNIIRTRNNLSNLIKTNLNDFETFATLTFADNVSNITFANICFNKFRTRIKKKFPNFKYIAIPEFQKRGAVHYHLITNISYDSDLLSEEEKIIYNKNKDKTYKFKTLKHWFYGFTSFEKIEQKDIVVNYMIKYLTKDIDNRLFGKRRYFYSQNLEKPIIETLDLNTLEHKNYYDYLIKDRQLIFNNSYFDYFGDIVDYEELKLIK